MGRASRLTALAEQRILECLKLGNYRDVAAHYAGVDPARLNEWINQGNPSHSRFSPRYASFRAKVLEIEAEAERRAVAIIQLQGQNDPRHLQWWLERKFPDRWGRKDRLQLTGPKDGPLQTVDLTKLNDEELDALADLLKRADGSTG